MPVKHGVDTDTFEEFVAHAEENPEEVQFEFTSRATYEGTVARSLAKMDAYTLGEEEIRRETREYTLPFGAQKEVEEAAGFVGPTDRLEPIEVSLAALAACINVGISMNALAAGIDLDTLKTTVRTDFDPGVLFNLKDLDQADTVFQRLEADITVDGEDLDDTARDQLTEMAQRAPVYTLFSLPQEISLNVETPDQEAEAADD